MTYILLLQDYRKGMHQYLTQHQYGNTFTEDLWRSLSEASGKPIEDIMNTWTKQMGFPVLKVTPLSCCCCVSVVPLGGFLGIVFMSSVCMSIRDVASVSDISGMH